MGDVDWVCLAPDRKVLQAAVYMVLSVQVVKVAGKCMASGARR